MVRLVSGFFSLCLFGCSGGFPISEGEREYQLLSGSSTSDDTFNRRRSYDRDNDDRSVDRTNRRQSYSTASEAGTSDDTPSDDTPVAPSGDSTDDEDTEEKECKNVSVYKFAFRDNYKEFQKSKTVDGEKFYVSRDILIPYKSWGWDGIKIVLTINRADTFYKAVMKWRSSGSNTQTMYYVKGDKMTGEEVFNTFRDYFTHFGFQDRSCGQASDSHDKKCRWKTGPKAPVVVCEGEPGY